LVAVVNANKPTFQSRDTCTQTPADNKNMKDKKINFTLMAAMGIAILTCSGAIYHETDFVGDSPAWGINATR
jgi:hypothetical protein